MAAFTLPGFYQPYPARRNLHEPHARTHSRATLPVVAALGSGTPAATELATYYHDDRQLSDLELAHVAALVERAGAELASLAQLAVDRDR